MSKVTERYPGTFSGEQIDQLLYKASGNGQQLSINVYGSTTIYGGMLRKETNTDIRSGVDKKEPASDS